MVSFSANHPEHLYIPTRKVGVWGSFHKQALTGAGMNVEIIAIGDEILLGQVQDTNSAWIARRFASEGTPIGRISVVGDDEKAINDLFYKAYHRSDVILITGGLGPTHDDLTKPLIAKFFDLPIVFRNDLLEQVRESYRRRQLKFLEASRTQAEFPEGAVPMPNPHGTAPGIWIEKQGRVFAAMPGVPVEMRAMVSDFVIPRLRKRRKSSITRFRTLHTYGIKEAALYEKLDNRQQVLEHAKLAFLPSQSGVRMRLTAEAPTELEAEGRLNEAEELLRSRLGAYIYAVGEEVSLERGVGERLKARGLKVAVAESCTGGLLAKKLTDTSGSTAWFERGWVTYSNEAKNELLGVPMELIEKHGAVSAEVAEAMAQGALERSHANMTVSITGVAGPTGGSEEKPVGLVYIGIADARGTEHHRFIFDTDRTVNRNRSVATALTLLMDRLSPKEGDTSDPVLI